MAQLPGRLPANKEGVIREAVNQRICAGEKIISNNLGCRGHSFKLFLYKTDFYV
jgi:hypothetical protein